MPIERVDEICGYVTLGRAAELLGVKTPRIHQLVEEGHLAAVALSTHADAKKSVMVLVEKGSIERYLGVRQASARRGPKPGSGGRPRKSERAS